MNLGRGAVLLPRAPTPWLKKQPIDDRSLVADYVERVEIQQERLFVQLAQIEKSGRRRAQGADTLDVPWCKTPITRHREMLLPTSDPPHQVRLCPGNSPVSARCLVFPCGSHHIRTRLHPKSICIGETEFLDPETNLPKSPSGQKRSPQRPKRNRKSPPIAGSLAVSGKSRGSKECVVGPAEPLKLAPHPDQSSSKINLHRGNGIPRPRDRPPKIAFRPETVSPETEIQPQEPANCGLLPSPGNLQVRGTAWWAREDSNLQPDRYERGYFVGNVDEIWRFPSLQPADVHDRLRTSVGEALAGSSGTRASLNMSPARNLSPFNRPPQRPSTVAAFRSGAGAPTSQPELQAAGCKSLRAIAAGLDARCIPASGWQVVGHTGHSSARARQRIGSANELAALSRQARPPLSKAVRASASSSH